MRSNQLLALLATFSLAGLALGAWVYFETHKVRRNNFDRIQLGMTEQQVENVLGESMKGEFSVPKRATGHSGWYKGHCCAITIYYDTAGLVEDMDFEEYPSSGWLAWFKRLVGF